LVSKSNSSAVGIGIARKGWLERKNVINCLPLEEVEKLLWLNKRRT
jgi:hypothetical protein